MQLKLMSINKNTDKAIFYPFFERNTFLAFTGFYMLIVFVIGLIIPEEIEIRKIHFIQYCFSYIPDLKNQVLHSDFPFVTAVIYLMVIMFSPLFAFILCFTKINLEAARNQLPNSILHKILLISLVLIICLSPYFFELNSTAGRKLFISELIEKEKIIFLIYTEIMFITYVCCWSFVITVVANFFKFLLRSK